MERGSGAVVRDPMPQRIIEASHVRFDVHEALRVRVLLFEKPTRFSDLGFGLVVLGCLERFMHFLEYNKWLRCHVIEGLVVPLPSLVGAVKISLDCVPRPRRHPNNNARHAYQQQQAEHGPRRRDRSDRKKGLFALFVVSLRRVSMAQPPSPGGPAASLPGFALASFFAWVRSISDLNV